MNKILRYDPVALPVQIPDKERKLTKIFILFFLCGASKDFMKTLKAFIKSFETPKRNLKIKIEVNLCFKLIFRNARSGKGQNAI